MRTSIRQNPFIKGTINAILCFDLRVLASGRIKLVLAIIAQASQDTWTWYDQSGENNDIPFGANLKMMTMFAAILTTWSPGFLREFSFLFWGERKSQEIGRSLNW